MSGGLRSSVAQSQDSLSKKHWKGICDHSIVSDPITLHCKCNLNNLKDLCGSGAAADAEVSRDDNYLFCLIVSSVAYGCRSPLQMTKRRQMLCYYLARGRQMRRGGPPMALRHCHKEIFQYSLERSLPSSAPSFTLWPVAIAARC